MLGLLIVWTTFRFLLALAIDGSVNRANPLCVAAMQSRRGSPAFAMPSLSFVLLCGLLAVLWLAGGGSRADVVGQIIVRSVAWLSLILVILLAPKPSFVNAKPLWLLLGTSILLVVIQLVPLPPAFWHALPGRMPFMEAPGSDPQQWRPWSLVPGATFNALHSLIVPLVVLVLASGASDQERAHLPAILLGLIFASMLYGLFQFSGGVLSNPLINDTIGQISGNFANRNHLALFLAFGCALAPVWALAGRAHPGWRGPVALGLMILFALTILATGSRAGLALGLVGVLAGIVLVWRDLKRVLARAPRWVLPALIAAFVAMIAIFVLMSVAADRAVAINRALETEAAEDMRSRGLPTVLLIIKNYFPFGSGFGSFDPIFRIHESFHLLKVTYFNHAHNDFLEIILDSGVAGVLMLLSTLGWLAFAGVRALRARRIGGSALPMLGFVLLLLVILASVVDYPARTPMMMAVVVLAGLWLHGNCSVRQSALPGRDQHL
jgi:O-antigen ligase